MPLMFAALIVVIGLVLSLIGAIPVLGDLVLGLAAIPAFAASLFVIYLLIIFVFSLFLVPVIAGLTKNDSFDTLFEVFSCVSEQPWRLLVYSVVLGVLSISATAILGWFSLEAARLGTAYCMSLPGEDGGDCLGRAVLPALEPAIMVSALSPVRGERRHDTRRRADDRRREPECRSRPVRRRRICRAADRAWLWRGHLEYGHDPAYSRY